jgi:hypothetical protein
MNILCLREGKKDKNTDADVQTDTPILVRAERNKNVPPTRARSLEKSWKKPRLTDPNSGRR